MWWSQRSSKTEPVAPSERTDYPYGTCVETEAGWFLIRSTMRFRIPTQRVLDSWRFNIVPSTEAAVKHFAIAGKLGFRDGTLINNIADGKMYVIAQNKKRHVVSPDVFDKYGFDWSMVVDVSEAETNLHENGEVIS